MVSKPRARHHWRHRVIVPILGINAWVAIVALPRWQSGIIRTDAMAVMIASLLPLAAGTTLLHHRRATAHWWLLSAYPVALVIGVLIPGQPLSPHHYGATGLLSAIASLMGYLIGSVHQLARRGDVRAPTEDPQPEGAPRKTARLPLRPMLRWLFIGLGAVLALLLAAWPALLASTEQSTQSGTGPLPDGGVLNCVIASLLAGIVLTYGLAPALRRPSDSPSRRLQRGRLVGLSVAAGLGLVGAYALYLF